MGASINDLLQGNEEWVKATKEEIPDFFDKIAQGQSPEYLWIGCSDSRVPATQVTNSKPGSIFVQRNIANMVVHTDLSLMSVVNYAVKHLKVKHIIICGHYGCGGVQAAMGNNSLGILDNWLTHIKDVYRIHQKELDAITDEQKRADRFVELNVQEQVNNMSRISFIQEEWKNGEYPYIHGCVFSLKEGKIKELDIKVNNTDHLDKVYRYD